MIESSQAPTKRTFWGRLKLIAFIAVAIVLSGLGGIGIALGLVSGPPAS